MRRQARRWAGMASLLLILLAACDTETATPSLDATPTDPPTPPVTTAAPSPTATTAAAFTGHLTWWQPDYRPHSTSPSSRTADAAAAAFTTRYPAITVDIVGYTNDAAGYDTLHTALAAPVPPDIIRAPADQIIPAAAVGQLAPIDPALTDADRADLYPNILAKLTDKGQTWGWPLWVSPTVMYLDTDLFTERNVALPDQTWSFEQFVDAAKKLTFARTDKTPVYGYSSALDVTQPNLWSFIYADNGRLLDPKTGAYDLDTPNAVKAITRLADLLNLYKITPPTFGTQTAADVRAAFRNRTLAMYSGPVTDAPDLRGAVPFALRSMPLAATGKQSLAGTIDAFGVTRHPQNPAREAAAQMLAHFLTGTDIAAAIPGYYTASPARRSVHLAPPDDPATPLVPYTDILPLTPQWPRIAALLQPHIQNAILGTETPDEALAAPTAAITALLPQKP